MTNQAIIDIVDEFLRDRHYDLIGRKVESDRRIVDDKVLILVRDFPGTRSSGTGKHQAEITLSDAHASPIVRDPGRGLPVFVVSILDNLIGSLVAERARPKVQEARA